MTRAAAGAPSDDPLHSADWYRVSRLILMLRPTLRVGRQVLRDEPWFVYRDTATGRQLRLNLMAHRFAGRIDGVRSVAALWDDLLRSQGDAAPSQQEIVTLVQQLAETGMVIAEQGVDLARLSRRETRRERRRLLAAANPLSLKIGLVDPSRLLDATVRYAAPFYTVWAGVIYLLLIAGGLFVAAQRWSELTAWGGHWMGTPGFALAMWLVYPLVKICHEMAHAWAVRVWGGQVTEMGISMLMLTPVPYVDASASALFESRARRVAVSLAGIVAELLLAVVALWVWLSVGDGMLRTLAFAVMLIGGASTVFVNGNPLLRFDGYFAFSDAIDRPNLAERSRALFVYGARCLIAGERHVRPPAGSRRDWPLLIGWGVAAWFYRVVMTWTLALWIADFSRLLGLALVVVGVWFAIGRPMMALFGYLWASRWRQSRPMRAMAGTALAVALPLALVTVVPMPDATTLPGVVVPDEAAKIRAPEPARVADVLVRPGDRVVAGTPLLRLNSDRLVAERDRLRAQLSGLESQRVRGIDQNLAGAGLSTGEIDRLRRQLADLDRRLDRLLVRSATEGSIAFIDADGPALRQAVQGEVLLYVVQPGALRVQAMARDDQVRRLADRVGPPQAHLADHPGEVLGLRLLAETPESTRVLPSPALGDRAGGPIATDPADRDGQFALEPWYQVEFVPDGPLPRIGATATVRITHASRPALEQMVVALRRVFVRRLEG